MWKVDTLSVENFLDSIKSTRLLESFRSIVNKFGYCFLICQRSYQLINNWQLLNLELPILINRHSYDPYRGLIDKECKLNG